MQRTTVGAVLRSTQAFCSQLCAEETLQCGIAYYSERYARLPEANQFREVVIDDPAQIPRLFELVEQWFGKRNLVCHRWAPAGGVCSPELAEFLATRDYRERRLSAMILTRWPKLDTSKEVRIVPARAMRPGYRETFLDAESPADPRLRELLADAYEDRLNDPQFDMSVALIDKKPVGRCAFYQVGDIARVIGPVVNAPLGGARAEQTLLAHVLGLARRLEMRTICVQALASDLTAVAFYEAAGFVCDGDIVEFQRDQGESDFTP